MAATLQTAAHQTVAHIAIVGNPNTGKSTLFGALAGVRQHVANYPGVTVEKKTGRMRFAGRQFELIDLPGLYSLAPRSRDEMVVIDALFGRYHDLPPIDVVICVVDASNLQRNLYLVSQTLDLGLRTIVAVNMLDVAERRGLRVDLKQLERRLGVPVVGVQAHRRLGIGDLKAALARCFDDPLPRCVSPLPGEIESEAAALAEDLEDELRALAQGGTSTQGLVRRLLLDSCGRVRNAILGETPSHAQRQVAAARARLTEKGLIGPKVETNARYAWVEKLLDGVAHETAHNELTLTDRIDRLLTHRVWGLAIFAVLMAVVFQTVFTGAQPLMRWIDSACGWLGDGVGAWMSEGALRSLLVDGVIGGIGSVLVFLPQILILFAFIAVMEDCGYMARAAFLMDRAMSRVGLSGKSFIPMLSCFACSIPGIMGARVVENERDRLTTILVSPLLTCSARLPIYALLIAAFIPPHAYLGGWLGLQGLTLFALYLLGIAAAVIVALTLKRTILRGETPAFLLELPTYKVPSLATVGHRVFERGWVFVRSAGTMILAVSVLVWAALYYPHNAPSARRLEAERAALAQQLAANPPAAPRNDAAAQPAAAVAAPAARLAELDTLIAGEYQRHSYLARIGRGIEPAVRPLGWDWRIGCAVLASFPAREIVVATMGIMYNVGEVDGDADAKLRMQGALAAAKWDGTDRRVFTLPVALSLMVFFALCAQCAATLVVMRRETGTWRWPLFAFTYMTALAYVAALAVYQVGTWILG